MNEVVKADTSFPALGSVDSWYPCASKNFSNLRHAAKSLGIVFSVYHQPASDVLVRSEPEWVFRWSGYSAQVKVGLHMQRSISSQNHDFYPTSENAR